MKNCRMWEGITLEYFMQDGLMWEGGHLEQGKDEEEEVAETRNVG